MGTCNGLRLRFGVKSTPVGRGSLLDTLKINLVTGISSYWRLVRLSGVLVL
jgi:hypothetical protein